MTDERANHFNVQLDREHAAKLRAKADRTHVQPGTVARTLLSTALDHADPDAATITHILDSIPGAFERAQESLEAARAGRDVPLGEL
jgi:hypothetical protein